MHVCMNMRFTLMDARRKSFFICSVLVLFSYWAIRFLNYKGWQPNVQTRLNEIQRLFSTSFKEVEFKEKKEKITIVYWSLFFGTVLKFEHLNLHLCPIPCEVTSDKTKVQQASALIIHARDPYPLPPDNLNNIPWILQSWENPFYTPILYDASYLANFTYLFTYRPDVADFYLPSFRIPSLTPAPVEFSRKTGLILAVFSNCEPVRTAYLKELMKYIQVDSYGACLTNKQGLPDRSSKDSKDKKTKLARNYKFTLVFTNQDCDYFVDDQLTHALTAGSVPVFLGTDKIKELLSGNLREAIVEVRDFKTPQKLAEYLKLLSENEKLYNRYLRWKYEGFQFPESFYQTVHGHHWQRRIESELSYHVSYCYICEAFAEAKLTGKQLKKKGLIQKETCKARRMQDWIHDE